MTRRLLHARQLADSDLNAGKPALRFFALFDGDRAGWDAATALKNLDPGIALWRDVFVLRPVMPLAGGDAIKSSIEARNREFGRIDCEMEDFIDGDLFSLFCEQETLEPRISSSSSFQHRLLDTAEKARLRRFVERNADFGSLQKLVNLALALRAYAGCPPVGSSLNGGQVKMQK